jgi:2-polyprenyl-3-methyl-5-hydroxy-6-metoxy-1,4-benzoquinol methylase
MGEGQKEVMGQEIDVGQIMDQIRENIRKRRTAGENPVPEKRSSPFDDGHAAADFAHLHSGYDIRNVSFVSSRRVVGSVVVAVRKVLRRLLAPMLDRQVAYNAASTRVTTHLKEWVGTLDREQAQAIQVVNAQMETLERTQIQLRDEVRDGQTKLRREALAIASKLRQEMLVTESRLPEVLAAQSRLRKDLTAQSLALEAALQAVNKQMETLEHSRTQLCDEVRDGHDKLRGEALALASKLRQEMLVTESRLSEVFATQSQLRQELLAIQSRLAADLAAQSQALQMVKQSSAAARERVCSAEQKLRRILHALETRQAHDGQPDTKIAKKPALPLPELEPDFDYARFEERFRGDEHEIKERQRAYLQYFQDKENILDIGCGRGEFLELLRESGIKAGGVDLDLDMVLLCREKGLDVVMNDAFAHLGALPDESVGGVFAAQVIEHLHPRRVIELIKLCYSKLVPGGILILETPNPKCLMVFADTFYKDPSHVQPAHPDTMQFLFEVTGFHEVELRFSAPVDTRLRIPLLQGPGADFDRFNAGIERLNSLLFGFQDYAVIGRKASARAR